MSQNVFGPAVDPVKKKLDINSLARVLIVSVELLKEVCSQESSRIRRCTGGEVAEEPLQARRPVVRARNTFLQLPCSSCKLRSLRRMYSKSFTKLAMQVHKDNVARKEPQCIPI